jgi:hypothetical protein
MWIQKSRLDVWIVGWHCWKLKGLIRIIHSVRVGRDGVVLQRGISRLRWRGKVGCRGNGRTMLFRFANFTGTGFEGLNLAKLSGWS